MVFSSASIIALIQHYGYTVIFPISIVEGPVVTLISGFLVSLGLLNAFVVFCILVLGDLIGDTLYYFLGRWGGASIIHRWEKRLGLNDEKIKKLTKYFKDRGWKLLLFSKTQMAGSVVLVSAGIANMPFGKFLKINLLGTIPKVIILEAIGIYGGASFAIINKYVNGLAAGFTVIAGVILAWWIYKAYSKKEKNSS